MRHWRSRLLAFTFAFKLSLIAVFIYSLFAGLFTPPPRTRRAPPPAAQSDCLAEASFTSPETILAALRSEDVGVRRETFRRLYVRPGVADVYFDYERDREYPERVNEARVRYVNLDADREPEALLTFVRFEQPVALVLKHTACGWQLCGALSAWLRFEDYPYLDWLELPELITPGTHELLVHESTGDASSYVRKARVLKLFGGALVQVAEFTEEEIKPLPDYQAADWSDVRQREVTRYSVARTAKDGAPRLLLEATGEVIRYAGDVPDYNYWLATDGAWHTLTHRHWRTRPATRIKLLGTRTQAWRWAEECRCFLNER